MDIKRVNALIALSYNYSFNGYLQVRFKIGIVLIEPFLSKISCLLDRDWSSVQFIAVWKIVISVNMIDLDSVSAVKEIIKSWGLGKTDKAVISNAAIHFPVIVAKAVTYHSVAGFIMNCILTVENILAKNSGHYLFVIFLIIRYLSKIDFAVIFGQFGRYVLHSCDLISLFTVFLGRGSYAVRCLRTACKNDSHRCGK